MNKKIPLSPFEVMKRMKDVPKILEWSRNKHLTVNGPGFWGVHHIYIDNFLKHIVFCLKSDLTTHIFIGNPVSAEEWRKYDRDVKWLFSKKLDNDVLEWKIYKDIILYKGKMLPPKEIPEEPYWGEVIKAEDFFKTINDEWIISAIKELYKNKGTVNEMDNFKKAIGYTSLGNKYGNQNKLDDAIKTFEKAIKFKSDYTPAYLGLAVAYREKGMLDEALRVLENAPRKIKMGSKLVGGEEYGIYSGMAAVYILKNDKQKAKEYAKKALLAFDDPERKEQRGRAREAANAYPDSVDKSILYGLNKNENEERELLKGLIEELDE